MFPLKSFARRANISQHLSVKESTDLQVQHMNCYGVKAMQTRHLCILLVHTIVLLKKTIS